MATRLPRDETLRWDDSQVYARVAAGAADGLYGYLDYISRQIIYDTAEGEYLLRWASIWGINPLPAVAATGSVTFAVTGSPVIPSGTLLTHVDGTQYELTDSATVSGGSATAPIAASLEGEAGNRITGATLTLVTPIAGVNSDATAGALTGGADAETIDATRARFLARIRQPPQGGAKSDYERWALEVPGVTRVWVAPLELGPGTVTVRFVRDGDASIIPDSTEIDTVAAYIEERRPVTAIVTVLGPTPITRNITVTTPSGLTSAQRAEIEAQFLSIIRGVEPGGILYKEELNQAVVQISGQYAIFITSPSTDVDYGAGEIPVLGAVTWA